MASFSSAFSHLANLGDQHMARMWDTAQHVGPTSWVLGSRLYWSRRELSRRCLVRSHRTSAVNLVPEGCLGFVDFGASACVRACGAPSVGSLLWACSSCRSLAGGSRSGSSRGSFRDSSRGSSHAISVVTLGLCWVSLGVNPGDCRAVVGSGTSSSPCVGLWVLCS